MKSYVAVTDPALYRFLRARPQFDEINFLQPSGRRQFRALEPGEPFLFKLHSPDHFIVGGGFFAAATLLPWSLAWEVFGERNGALSPADVERRLGRYRRRSRASRADHPVGCVILQSPFFFDEADWIPAPRSFSKSIVQGKTYDTETPEGRALWESVRLRLQPVTTGQQPDSQADMFGDPVLIHPRIGPGAFRVLVTEAYGRRCAISGDAALPALEVATIRPPNQGGLLRVDNGMLMRADLRRLFDRGFLTVTPGHVVKVSRQLESAYRDTDAYGAFDGREILPPIAARDRPRPEFLAWHERTVFRG